MSSSATDTQIKKAYEEYHMLPSQISEDFGFEETAVKAKLMQISPVYRKDCGKEPLGEDPSLNFSDDDLKDANKVIADVMLCATLPDGSVDYRTRLKAAEYVRDDKKGRKEQVRAIQNGPQVNIFSINDAIQQARLAASMATKQLTEKSAIVQEEPSKQLIEA
jgi:hypothetical protein